MLRVELALMAEFPASPMSFRAGAAEFERFLSILKKRVDFFNDDWYSQWSKDGPRLSFKHDRDAFLDAFEKHFVEAFSEYNAGQASGYGIWCHDSKDRLLTLEMSWEAERSAKVVSRGKPTQLSGDFRSIGGDDSYLSDFIGLVDVITMWKRPLHVWLAPFLYVRDHHPLDRRRQGIGWMGWVPFAITPSDVPEAEIIRPMNGGTLIVIQRAFWQAFPKHPLYSPEAIARAQEVEIRLNLLGVLPTDLDLQRGDWGQ